MKSLTYACLTIFIMLLFSGIVVGQVTQDATVTYGGDFVPIYSFPSFVQQMDVTNDKPSATGTVDHAFSTGPSVINGEMYVYNYYWRFEFDGLSLATPGVLTINISIGGASAFSQTYTMAAGDNTQLIVDITPIPLTPNTTSSFHADVTLSTGSESSSVYRFVSYAPSAGYIDLGPVSSCTATAGSISTDVISGIPGSTVNVTGSGWKTGTSSTQYTVLFGGIPIATQTNNSCSDQPSLSFNIPCDIAPGQYPIVCNLIDVGTQQTLATSTNTVNFTVTQPTGIHALAPSCVSSIAITPFTVVPRGSTVPVNITVNPSLTGPINLKISRQSGKSGAAVFLATGTDTLIINGTTTVALRGDEASDLTGNLTLTASGNGYPTVTQSFTVLWVKISISTKGTLSKDNTARNIVILAAGSDKLGFLFNTGSLTQNHYWQNRVELSGEVMPKDFKEPIVLAREAHSIIYKDGQGTDSPTHPDTSFKEFRSDIPSAKGIIYDSDAPGVGFSSTDQPGTVKRQRISFRQFAIYGGVVDDDKGTVTGGVKVSDDFFWHSYVSVMKPTTGNDVPDKTFVKSGDNSAGSGAGVLSIDLK